MPDLSRRRGPSRATVAAAALVALGFALTAVHWGFLVLVGVGAFGPGLLREWGLLRDKDELQLQAARRAGYHAYLAGGLMCILLIARVRSADRILAHTDELATAVLSVMWFTWLLSSLHGYWGSRVTARRILLIFGWVWLAFNVAGNLRDPVALVIQSLLAVPFFALAWLAGRRPRIAGWILIGCAAAFFWFFGLYRLFGAEPFARGRLEVTVLFIGPLVAAGVMLITGANDDAVDGDQEEAVIQGG